MSIFGPSIVCLSFVCAGRLVICLCVSLGRHGFDVFVIWHSDKECSDDSCLVHLCRMLRVGNGHGAMNVIHRAHAKVART